MKHFSYLILLLLIWINNSVSLAQATDFTKEVRLDNRSTILRNILLENDSLIVTGEIGRDSLDLSGFFVFKMDTFGNIGNIKYFRDPNLSDHALLDGFHPVLMATRNSLILSGHYLAYDDAYFLILNQSLDSVHYKVYESNYRYLVIEKIIAMHEQFFLIGTAQTQEYDLDVFIMKVDSIGNKIWEKTYGLQERDESGFSAINEDTGITIKVAKSYNPTPTTKNDTRYWSQFMHIDTSGAVKWMWEEEVTGDEGYGGVFIKYDNDYIYTTNYLGDEYSAGILQAPQLVRRDSDFNLIWRKVYGERDNFYNGFGDMIMSKDSNLLLAGQILDSSGDFNWARVMKICPNGEIICETRDTGYVLANGESLNRMEGIVESPTGSIYAVGYTNRSLFLFDGLILKASPDGCIDTLCTTTAIENLIRLKEQKIVVYPNPIQDQLNITADESLPHDASVSVYNAVGHLVFKGVIEGSHKNLDASTWAEGIYIIRVEANGRLIGSVKAVKNSL